MKKQLILLTVAALATVGVSGQTDEFSRLLQKARSGDTEAQMTVADKYRDGDGTEQNDEKALFWYSKLASPQHPEAEHMLGVAFLKGLGTECDFDKGVEWFTRAALHGSIEAQFELGVNYYFGWEYPAGKFAEDNDRAYALFSQAAAQEHPASPEYRSRAMLYLGYCHNGGYGVEKSPEAAVEWFVRAAEEGNATAAYEAGRAYAEGIGTEPDLTKAFAYYKQSAEANDPDAQRVMAEYYDEGRDGMVEPDARAAFDWTGKPQTTAVHTPWA